MSLGPIAPFLFAALLSSVCFADSQAATDNSDNIPDEIKTESRLWIDRADHLLGGTRTDDNRDSATVRLRLTDQVSRDVRMGSPELHIGWTVKFGKIQVWQDEINHWIQKRLNTLKEEAKSLFTSSKHATSNGKIQGRAGERSVNSTSKVKDPWTLTTQKSIVVARHPKFWIKERLRKDLEYGKLVHSFYTEVGWSTSTRWETNAGFDSNLALAPRWVLRFGNQVHYGISEHVFTTSHGPLLIYVPGDHQVLSFGVSMGSSIVEKAWVAENYTVSGGYRLTTWHRAVSLSINPFMSFARADHFYRDLGATFSLESIL